MDIFYVLLKLSAVCVGISLFLAVIIVILSAPPIPDDEEEPYGEASSYRRDREATTATRPANCICWPTSSIRTTATSPSSVNSAVKLRSST